MKTLRQTFRDRLFTPHGSSGFTLIETLAAISLLSVAIMAPMTLTTRSLAASYYARDQVTAYYLAQEAIETLRSIRDGQILKIVQSTDPSSINIFGSIEPYINNGQPFIIDALDSTITQCPTPPTPCSPIQTNATRTLYGYEIGWTDTNFTRTVTARKIKIDSNDEIRVTVEVSWKTGSFQTRKFSISVNLYRWIQ